MAKPNEDDPSKKDSGYWRITRKGARFVRNRIRISKRIFLRLGEFKGEAGTEEVNHKEANEECHFHFQELMNQENEDE